MNDLYDFLSTDVNKAFEVKGELEKSYKDVILEPVKIGHTMFYEVVADTTKLVKDQH